MLRLNKLFFMIILCLSHSLSALQTYTLITVLYNERHAGRMQEFITCLEKNLNHKAIKEIVILYDDSKDDEKNELFNYLKAQSVKLKFIKGRPTFGDCFDIANREYPNSRIIISNADIYFNETLHLLDAKDFNNKFIALTRWNELNDGSLQIFKQYDKDGNFDLKSSSLSQDAWIFETPLKKFENSHFQLGTWACDGYIAYQAYISGLYVVNPCWSVQACHLHLSNIRHWIPQSIPGAKALILPWCSIENL